MTPLFVRPEPRPTPTDCCPQCWQRREVCFCPQYPRVETQTEIVIIRQSVEAGKSSNTARIAALALPNCRILDYGGGEPFDEARLLADESWLLYPDSGGPEPREPPRRLVVLDGTWKQARKMFIRIGPLQRMPRLALSASDSAPRARLRKAPREGALSTLEAIAQALTQLEGADVGRPLFELHEQLALRGLFMRGLKFDGVVAPRSKSDEPGFAF